MSAFSASNNLASSTVAGTLIPNFILFFLLLVLNLPIILPRLLSSCSTHQRNAGSFDKPLLSMYSVRSTGNDLLTKESGCQLIEPSLHLTWTSHPFVVIMGLFLPFTIAKASGRFITETSLFHLISRISSDEVASQSLLSTCSTMFSSIEYSSTLPSGYSSS